MASPLIIDWLSFRYPLFASPRTIHVWNVQESVGGCPALVIIPSKTSTCCQLILRGMPNVLKGVNRFLCLENCENVCLLCAVELRL